MASFDNNIGKMEQTLRRALTQEERRLLKLWDLTCESAARAKLRAEAPVQPVDEKTYTGRFKIVATKGYYEIYFVCGKLLLPPSRSIIAKASSTFSPRTPSASRKAWLSRLLPPPTSRAQRRFSGTYRSPNACCAAWASATSTDSRK
jgi:hypothetical protein